MESLFRLHASDRQRILWFLLFGISAIFISGILIAFSTVSALAVLFVLVVGIPCGWWFLRDHRVGLTLAILSVVPGNLIRLSLGTDVRGGAAILVSDLVIPLLVLVWVLGKLTQNKKCTSTPVNVPLIAFTLIALASYVQGLFILDRVGTLELKEAIVAFLYWGRWVEYALLFFIASDIVRTEKDVRYFLRVLLLGALLVSIAGFIQLIVYPDFTEYAILHGWDPHQDRLLSTFFDPNFVGGFLALILSAAIGIFFYELDSRIRMRIVLVSIVLLVALVLTFSRSGYLALMVAIAMVSILRSRILIVIAIVGAIITFVLVPRSFARVTAGLSFDETALKRVESWVTASSIIPMYPILGTGYNMLASVQDDLGTVDEFDVNNRSGVENSFLTVLLTTGLVGFTAFTYLYFVILRSLYRNWKNKAIPERWRGLNLGVCAGILGLVFHSIFLHSLMYPFILIYFWTLIALALKSAQLNTTHTPISH